LFAPAFDCLGRGLRGHRLLAVHELWIAVRLVGDAIASLDDVREQPLDLFGCRGPPGLGSQISRDRRPQRDVADVP
jgi:hypothetical protein